MARRSKEPRWLTRTVIDAVHADQVREHGGLAGVRDEHVLESALARPQHKLSYGEEPDIATLAAAYGFGLVRIHPYHDGNKRIGFLAAATFLGINGYDVVATDADIVKTMVALAEGKLTESQLAAWIRDRLEPLA